MRHRPTAQIFNPNRYSLHTRLRLRNGIRTVFIVLLQLRQKLSGFAGFGGGAHQAGQGMGPGRRPLPRMPLDPERAPYGALSPT